MKKKQLSDIELKLAQKDAYIQDLLKTIDQKNDTLSRLTNTVQTEQKENKILILERDSFREIALNLSKALANKYEDYEG